MAKILLIEDDQLIARMYQKIFTFEDMDIEWAENGQAGLDKLKTIAPTLILLDVMMPVMDGLAVLDKIKNDPKLKSIPVVMLTNLADQESAESATKKGALKYIVKSEHDPKQIAEIVKDILKNINQDKE